MNESLEFEPRRLRWVGSSRRDLLDLPREVCRQIGQGLGLVQLGGMPHNAKPLSGFGGASVLELRDRDAAGTYRTVFTVRFVGVVYVLHVFQKKSKQGIATDRKDIELVKARLQDAETHYSRYSTNEEG